MLANRIVVMSILIFCFALVGWHFLIGGGI